MSDGSLAARIGARVTPGGVVAVADAAPVADSSSLPGAVRIPVATQPDPSSTP
jgi:hypothetical protein